MKRVAKWTTFAGATADQLREALARTPAERLAMVQRIREAHWGCSVELQPEWNEFLGLLRHHGVRFVLVGGLAVGVYGHERYTKDLDLLVDPSEPNARRVGSALTDFGFAATGRAWRRLTEPYQVLTLGVEPVRIDLLTSISGVAFRTVWKGRGKVRTAAGELPVIGLAELRANKLATGRPQDLADVAQLDAAARKKVSRAHKASGTRKPRKR